MMGGEQGIYMLDAPSTAFKARQLIEQWAESERAQLPLWVPVALGAGVCAWFALPTPGLWITWCLISASAALLANAFMQGSRLGAALAIGGALAVAGCLLPWGKAALVGAPPLARPAMVAFEAKVEHVERLDSRHIVRLRLAPIERTDLPRQLRVNMPVDAMPEGVSTGARIALRAYLMPPPPAVLPGAYNYAMRAYFEGIGATGRVIGPVRIIAEGGSGSDLRARLAEHIRSRLTGAPGAIAVTLATGDQSGIPQADADAMRRSGLAHLLSISGLHVTALIGAVIFMVARLLALSPAIALRWPLLLIAASVGAFAGIGYTLMTGAHVPTIRACIAALLVIGGMALGREAISLRLIATGAIIVMIFWPEALLGPSFQMSFAAVTSIVALYEFPPMRRLIEKQPEPRWKSMIRALGGLFATGLVVEIVLAPIALYHFHHSGLLGAIANIVAIPLTSFVIMPAEAIALTLDIAGFGAPAWAVADGALKVLLWIAHHISSLPYSVALAPLIAGVTFGVTISGLLWMMLWRTPIRWAGAVPALGGALLIATAPGPDILVTRDGRHVALRLQDGRMALLRDRAGDYVRSALSQSAGFDGDLEPLADLPEASCTGDLCRVSLKSDPGALTLLASRSNALVPIDALVMACADADIVISDRALPRRCAPRWLKLDRPALQKTGGAAITLSHRKVVNAYDPRDAHPWIIKNAVKARPFRSTTDGAAKLRHDQLYRRSNPASLP